jgi:hypothetical protein
VSSERLPTRERPSKKRWRIHAGASEADDIPVAPGAEGEPDVPAPHHWSAADRAEFAGLDARARAFVLRRHKAMEADYTRKTQEVAASRKAADSILAVAKPYAQLIAAEGGTPETAFRALLSTAHRLRHGSPAEKSRELVGLARRFGVDLAHAAGFSASVAPSQAAALAEVTARQMHVEQQLQREARDRSAAQVAYRAREVKSFRNAKAKDGTLLHPHLQDVVPEMAALLGSGRASSLQEAYDRAVWANPTTRPRAGIPAAAGSPHKRAADAKRAARVPKGGALGTPPNRGRTIEDTMSLTYDRLHGGRRE